MSSVWRRAGVLLHLQPRSKSRMRTAVDRRRILLAPLCPPWVADHYYPTPAPTLMKSRKTLTIPTFVLRGSVALMLTAPIQAQETKIKVNAATYVPFNTTRAVGTTVYLNGDNTSANTDVRATQRSL